MKKAGIRMVVVKRRRDTWVLGIFMAHNQSIGLADEWMYRVRKSKDLG